MPERLRGGDAARWIHAEHVSQQRARVGGRARSREERVESPGSSRRDAASRSRVHARSYASGRFSSPPLPQSLRDGIEHIGGRGAAEERVAEETFGHDASRGPDVGGAGSLARRRGVADELLGGAVPSRAAVRDAGVRGAELGRLAEIGELGDAVGDEHVLRLDVAVGPTALVAVLEGDEEMSNGRRDDGLGKRAQAARARAR